MIGHPVVKKIVLAGLVVSAQAASAVDYHLPFGIVVSVGEKKPDISEGKYKQINDLARCYAGLLGVSVPGVSVKPFRSDLSGAYDFRTGEVLINSKYLGEMDRVAGTVAHEVRHHWQYVNRDSLGYSVYTEARKKYHERKIEIDAYRWEADYKHKCFHDVVYDVDSSWFGADSGVSGACIHHRVVRGDTWWSLKRKYNKSVSWVKKNTNKSLQLGKVVCISLEVAK